MLERTCSSEGRLSRTRLRVLRLSHGADCSRFVRWESDWVELNGSVHMLEGEDEVDAETSEGGEEGWWKDVSSRADALRLSPILMFGMLVRTVQNK